jgi:hypothetical protein
MKLITAKREAEGQAGAGTAQLIQERAYEHYLERGRQAGHELEDWLKAERELRQLTDRQHSA